MNSLTKLTVSQAKNWGTLYMTLRGAFMLPMFTGLAIAFTPWALALGLFCLLQGVIYRLSNEVLIAEWVAGVVEIGIPLAAILMLGNI